MGKATTLRKATGMQDGDTTEVVSQWSIAASAWVLTTGAQTAILATSTANASASVNRFVIVSNGAIVVQATSTSGGFTGINMVSNTALIAACYRTAAGTLAVVAGTAAATIGAAGMPAVPATAVQYGFLNIITSAGGVFTGGTTALDSASLTVDWMSCVGPVGMCMITGPIGLVSGG